MAEADELIVAATLTHVIAVQTALLDLDNDDYIGEVADEDPQSDGTLDCLSLISFGLVLIYCSMAQVTPPRGPYLQTPRCFEYFEIALNRPD